MNLWHFFGEMGNGCRPTTRVETLPCGHWCKSHTHDCLE